MFSIDEIAEVTELSEATINEIIDSGILNITHQEADIIGFSFPILLEIKALVEISKTIDLETLINKHPFFSNFELRDLHQSPELKKIYIDADSEEFVITDSEDLTAVSRLIGKEIETSNDIKIIHVKTLIDELKFTALRNDLKLPN